MKKRLLLLPFEPLSYQPFYVYSFEVDGICYNINRGTSTCSVTYRKSLRYSGKVVIPASVIYDGKEYSVTSIDCGAFYGCSGLTSVEIPDSVTSIGQSAFSGCIRLTSVTIPNSVTSIGESAFYCCSGLTSVEIPNSVTSIGESAFYGCSALTSVEIPNSVTEIGNCAFSGCSGLTSVEIPNSVTSIGDFAFYHCSALTSVSIPNSVASIGNYAFDVCKALTNLIIEDGETTLSLGYNFIGEGLFYDCPLETLHLGRTLSYKTGEDYGYSPFAGKSSLKQVTIGNSVTSISNCAFYDCSGLTSVVIPNSVTSIGNYAFNGCKALTNLIIEDGETTLSLGYNTYDDYTHCGEGLFYDCPLESLHLGRNLSYKTGKEYGYSPFYGKSSLKQVTIGNSVTEIGELAFYGCSGLTSVTIPGGVRYIRSGAFEGCSGFEIRFLR